MADDQTGNTLVQGLTAEELADTTRLSLGLCRPFVKAAAVYLTFCSATLLQHLYKALLVLGRKLREDRA